MIYATSGLMSRTPDQIVQIYEQRRAAAGPMHARLVKVRDLIGPDATVVPLPELDKAVQSSVANIARMGLEQLSMRVASTMPVSRFVPVKIGSSRSQDQARTKQQVVTSWWDASLLRLAMRERARHMWGYASSPVLLRPDFERHVPGWHVRDPLATFAAPRVRRIDPVPDDCIFTYTATLAWLRERYGARVADLRVGKDCAPTARFTILEYVDAEQIVQIVLGAARDERLGMAHPDNAGADWRVIEWYPNRCERPVAVVPEAITLGEPYSRFESAPAMYYQQAYINALNVEAIKRSIFPNTWLVARPNENPEIIDVADGVRGLVGRVKGGDFDTMQPNPGYKTIEALSNGERVQRLEGGVPAEFGGESTSTVRTGRRGDAIMSAAVDFPVQEIQEIFEVSLEAEVRIAISQDKAYFGSMPISMYTRGHAGRSSVVTHRPDKLWDVDEVHVRYSMAGSDTNALTVAVGQLLGMRLISPESARELLPLIEDADLEHDRVIADGIEAALLSSIQQQAANPEGPYQPGDLAFLAEQVMTKKATLYEAIQATQERAQVRQAAQAQMTEPALMPGLSAPGAPGEPIASVPAPSEGQANLTQLLNQLRTARSAAAPARVA